MRVIVRGESFQLLPERCLFWPSQRLLVVADCHFGKAETFQQRGLWLPSAPIRRDLAVLSALTSRLAVEHVLFLGDFVHSRAGVTENLIRELADWITAYPGQVQVVVGNHDAGLIKRWPPSWSGVTISERVHMGDFAFQHQPVEEAGCDQRFYWSGHVHPVIGLSRGPDRLRLPAFIISDSRGLLPAFSPLAGGFEMPLSSRDRIFVTGKDEVYEVQRHRETKPIKLRRREYS